MTTRRGVRSATHHVVLCVGASACEGIHLLIKKNGTVACTFRDNFLIFLGRRSNIMEIDY